MAGSDFVIQNVERIPLHLPFHSRCADVMVIRVPFWELVELCKVTLASGVVGYGETLIRQTRIRPEPSAYSRLKGKNLFDCLWDDQVGTEIQMALFDAAGKALGVPCHRLMGKQFREACPVSWWAQDMTPEGWAGEARIAEAEGFTSMKVKARPWFYPEDQMAAVSEAVSPHFKLDMDFNSLLLGEDAAAPLISRLEERYTRLAIVESPIPQEDVAGNAVLRRKIKSPIAMHFGNPRIMTAIKEGVCDGFVIGGGASRVIQNGTLAGQAGMPFWLQLCGTGITTIFSAHLGAVLSHARWPAIPCVNIYSHPLVKEFKVEGGFLTVPDGPGLGVDLDLDAIEGFRVDLDFKLPDRREIHTIHWADGRKTYYPDGLGYRQDFLDGKLLGFLPGMSLDRRSDDGSDAFDREYSELF